MAKHAFCRILDAVGGRPGPVSRAIGCRCAEHSGRGTPPPGRTAPLGCHRLTRFPALATGTAAGQLPGLQPRMERPRSSTRATRAQQDVLTRTPCWSFLGSVPPARRTRPGSAQTMLLQASEKCNHLQLLGFCGWSVTSAASLTRMSENLNRPLLRASRTTCFHHQCWSALD